MFENMFIQTSRVPNYSTRQTGLLYVQYSSTERTQRTIKHYRTKSWNCLCISLLADCAISTFKQKCSFCHVFFHITHVVITIIIIIIVIITNCSYYWHFLAIIVIVVLLFSPLLLLSSVMIMMIIVVMVAVVIVTIMTILLQFPNWNPPCTLFLLIVCYMKSLLVNYYDLWYIVFVNGWTIFSVQLWQ